MARSARGMFGESGGMARGVGASSGRREPVITVRKSASGKVTKTGSMSKKQKSESFSYSEKDLTKKERKQIRNQNKIAESMKSKSLEKVTAGKKGAATRKLRQEEREEYAYSKGNKRGEKVGIAKGAIGTVVVGAATKSLYDKNKKKKK